MIVLSCSLLLFQSYMWQHTDAQVAWLVGWLVVLRINVDLAIFQPYLDLEVGDNQSLKIQVVRPGIEPRSSCSASQGLNHSATAAPHRWPEEYAKTFRWVLLGASTTPTPGLLYGPHMTRPLQTCLMCSGIHHTTPGSFLGCNSRPPQHSHQLHQSSVSVIEISFYLLFKICMGIQRSNFFQAPGSNRGVKISELLLLIVV